MPCAGLKAILSTLSLPTVQGQVKMRESALGEARTVVVVVAAAAAAAET